MKHILSFSGGKDSLATFLLIQKENLPLDEVIFCDTFAEWDEIENIVRKIESICLNKNIKFTKLKNQSFLNILAEKKFWPIFNRRWCTDLIKNRQLRDYLKEKYGLDNVIQYVGFAYDEKERALGNNFKSKHKHYSFPLIDYKITEKQALKMCYDAGYDWNGLYNYFSRLGCFCCPLMKVKDVKTLITNFPKEWEIIKRWEKRTKNKWKHKGCEYWERKVNND